MSSFTEKRNYQGQLVKALSKFGKSKEICITPFHGRTYVHLSDIKNCFEADGSFDLSKSRSITFNVDEIRELSALLVNVPRYDGLLHPHQVTTPPRERPGIFQALGDYATPPPARPATSATSATTTTTWEVMGAIPSSPTNTVARANPGASTSWEVVGSTTAQHVARANPGAQTSWEVVGHMASAIAPAMDAELNGDDEVYFAIPCLPYEELNNLTGLFAAMKDYYDDKPPFKMTKADITIGNWYAGWRDQLWYRVRVTQFATEELLSVYLIDHGEYSVMGLEEIQPLYKQFYALPMMAIHARLGVFQASLMIINKAMESENAQGNI